MKLPKSMTTVTTFSKTLALILFVVLPFLGFYLGTLYQKNVDTISVNQQKLQPLPKAKTGSKCQSNSQCPSGQYCTVVGPIMLNPITRLPIIRKECVAKGQAIPL